MTLQRKTLDERANVQIDPIFEPFPGRIVVEVDEQERYGKLFLPTTGRERSTFGYVLAVFEPEDADGEYEYRPYARVGDFVLFGKNAGAEVKVGTKRVIVLKESEILTRVRFPSADAEAETKPVMEVEPLPDWMDVP